VYKEETKEYNKLANIQIKTAAVIKINNL